MLLFPSSARLSFSWYWTLCQNKNMQGKKRLYTTGYVSSQNYFTFNFKLLQQMFE